VSTVIFHVSGLYHGRVSCDGACNLVFKIKLGMVKCLQQPTRFVHTSFTNRKCVLHRRYEMLSRVRDEFQDFYTQAINRGCELLLIQI